MARARTELIHCDNCGEDYADTYRRCPFCNAKAGRKQEGGYDDADYGYDDGHRGGKRLAGGGKGGGNGHPVKTALYILSALVILAAIWVMCTMVIPKILDLAPAGESPSPSVPAAVVPSAEPSAEPSPDAEPSPSYTTELPSLDDDPLALDSPDLPPVETDTLTSQAPASDRPSPSVSPSPAVTASPAPSAAALRLSSTDFTLSPRYPTYQLEIAGVGRAMATYSVKNEGVATVNSTGLITAVADGSTTLTVTDDKGNTATAIVRVSGMSGSQAPASESPASEAPASTGSARLNKTDFSITASFPDPYRLQVTDGEAASWSSKNESIATVSGDGTVTGVGNGTTTITCTLTDGAKLTCTVHVSGK